MVSTNKALAFGGIQSLPAELVVTGHAPHVGRHGILQAEPLDQQNRWHFVNVIVRCVWDLSS
jgi:hypothetical protein